MNTQHRKWNSGMVFDMRTNEELTIYRFEWRIFYRQDSKVQPNVTFVMIRGCPWIKKIHNMYITYVKRKCGSKMSTIWCEANEFRFFSHQNMRSWEKNTEHHGGLMDHYCQSRLHVSSHAIQIYQDVFQAKHTYMNEWMLAGKTDWTIDTFSMFSSRW